MKVEIWSDIVCPFCYIGKRRFEKALSDFEGREKVEIEWKSFQLDPDLENNERLHVNEYLSQKKGITPEAAQRMNENVSQMAKEAGLEFNFDKAVINNTMNAHRLLHFAKTKNLKNELKEKLLKAYFTDGKDIADHTTLTDLAVEVGLNGEDVTKVLAENLYEDEVRYDQQQAYQVGVRGVPYFVFNGKYGVSGAQSSEVFSEILDKVGVEERSRQE